MLLRHALRPLPLRLPLTPTTPTPRILKPFTTTPKPAKSLQLPPLSPIPESDLTEAFLKGSGPGGQKINKTSSAVQLKHLPTGIVIKSQATRSRSQNRKIARRLLAEKLEVLEKGEESRVVVKGEAKRRKKASKGKKARRKYRGMSGVGEEEEGEEVVGGEEEEGDNGREEEDRKARPDGEEEGRT